MRGGGAVVVWVFSPQSTIFGRFRDCSDIMVSFSQFCLFSLVAKTVMPIFCSDRVLFSLNSYMIYFS